MKVGDLVEIRFRCSTGEDVWYCGRLKYANKENMGVGFFGWLGKTTWVKKADVRPAPRRP